MQPPGLSWGLYMKEADHQYRVLIIDDEPMILDILELYLSLGEYKYRVTTAENGIEGLKNIASDSYDLIITDLSMPGLTGTQIVEHVKKGSHSHTPVLGISGMPWLFKDSPFDAVLCKPFTMEIFLKAVAELTEPNYFAGETRQQTSPRV